ncbi:YwqI/YxiC family protein [Terribacillus saccharophilus]|uniref:YwqI/YxiC family protein n=1 Tax=Terribacillus saccharophilus TaxID=361277 RepID=UPI00398214B1
MSEIKLKADIVQQKLSDLQRSLADFHEGDPGSGSGDEMLDVQVKINNVNESLKSLVQEYQGMALQHVEASSSAVDSLVKAEKAVADIISTFKLG